MAEALIILGGSLLADIIGTMLGFGAATVFMPFALLIFGFHDALVVVGISHIMSNIFRMWYFRTHVDRRLALAFIVPGVAASILGALVTAWLPIGTLLTVFGAMLLLYALAGLSAFRPKLAAKGRTAWIGGASFGFIAGLIGTAGAVRAAFLNAFALSKETYIGTSAAIAIAIDAVRVPVYVADGGFDAARWWYVPALLVTAWIGTNIGKAAVARMPLKLFRAVVYAGLAVFALKFIHDGLTA